MLLQYIPVIFIVSSIILLVVGAYASRVVVDELFGKYESDESLCQALLEEHKNDTR
jgi:hypothetical protein